MIEKKRIHPMTYKDNSIDISNLKNANLSVGDLSPVAALIIKAALCFRPFQSFEDR
jgi:hypothetical protein